MGKKYTRYDGFVIIGPRHYKCTQQKRYQDKEAAHHSTINLDCTEVMEKYMTDIVTADNIYVVLINHPEGCSRRLQNIIITLAFLANPSQGAENKINKYYALLCRDLYTPRSRVAHESRTICSTVQ